MTDIAETGTRPRIGPLFFIQDTEAGRSEPADGCR